VHTALGNDVDLVIRAERRSQQPAPGYRRGEGDPSRYHPTLRALSGRQRLVAPRSRTAA
jgi:hypothetical protein